MHLKRLELHGFKTFAERTEVHFTSGITAILGPNGSGKSNIADALLWVLGENNIRALRGALTQDVIFAGNERRRPLGFAEVALTVDNSDGALPLPFPEITVTRRVYRSGESECFINRAACRLKDIYELFLDTGVGRDGYGLVSQGEIDQILSVRAEDRRAIFEEAAGIKKYRVRKREAERKMENTQQNLLRVADILAEIESQLEPLKRQAQAARRYRELAQRLRLLEEAWYGTRLRALSAEGERMAALEAELSEERARLEAEMAGTRTREQEARRALAALEEALERCRAAQAEGTARAATMRAEAARAEERAAEAARRAALLERELAAAEIRRAALRDEADAAAADVADLERELAARTRQVAEAARAAETARSRASQARRAQEARRQAALVRVRQEAERQARVEALAERLSQRQELAAQAAAALAEAQAELDQFRKLSGFQELAGPKAFGTADPDCVGTRTRVLQAEAAAARAAHAAREADTVLRALHAERDGVAARRQALITLTDGDDAQGADALLAAAAAGELPGPWQRLLDALRVPAHLERAVGAALGPYARAVATDNPAALEAARSWLAKRGAGAILFGPPGLSALPIRGDSLAGQIEAAGPAAAAARAVLGRAFLVPELPNPTPVPSLTGRSRYNQDSLVGKGAGGLGATHAPEFADHGTNFQIGEESEGGCWMAVTPRGDWLASVGAVHVAAAAGKDPVTAALARRREIEALGEQLAALEAALANREAAARDARDTAERAAGALHEARVAAEAARLAHQAAQDALAAAERERAQAERRRQAAADRHAHALREVESARHALTQASQPSVDADTSPLVGEGLGEGADDLETESFRDAHAAEQALADARVARAALESRLVGARAQTSRARQGLEEAERSLCQRREERAALREEAPKAFGAAELSERAAALVEQAERAAAALARAQAERLEHAARAEEAARAAARLSERLREVADRAHRVEVERTAVEAERRHLQAQWDEARLLTTEDPDGSSPTREELAAALAQSSDPQGDLQRLRRQIRSLGPVNLEAEAQYAALSERYAFLQRERTDLEQASDQLRAAIQELDAASRQAFRDAFHQIAAAFDEMFRLLFDGGRTELRLTDAHDILESGVEIIVQPPGKRAQNLLLLSGGERALTAVAMLFALLKVRPSPFCVLDEVDAALDETNVGRFIAVLRQFAAHTQFIVITHNRGTMEAADTLYGTTVEEKGVSRLLACRLEDAEWIENGRDGASGNGVSGNGASGNGTSARRAYTSSPA
ncbi:MAG: AAA family ATPase [Armatimonadetes bacterium]|nr:AAA family ATPase [Armatimonadota bacterium]